MVSFGLKAFPSVISMNFELIDLHKSIYLSVYSPAQRFKIHCRNENCFEHNLKPPKMVGSMKLNV